MKKPNAFARLSKAIRCFCSDNIPPSCSYYIYLAKTIFAVKAITALIHLMFALQPLLEKIQHFNV